MLLRVEMFEEVGENNCFFRQILLKSFMKLKEDLHNGVSPNLFIINEPVAMKFWLYAVESLRS